MTEPTFPHACPADAPRTSDSIGEPLAIDRSRQAVLLMAYGSVDSLDQVEAYYTDIRRGSPPPRHLLEELLERYRAIGGASPLSGHTERQRVAVQTELGRRGHAIPVYSGMKHITPFIADTVARMASDGVTHVVALALAPHFSTMSVAAYCAAVDTARRGLDRPISYEMVHSWHAEPHFIDALAGATAEALERLDRPGEDAHIVFTAHSLPAKILDRGDPYPDLLVETARLVAEQLGHERWTFAFQSAGRTADPWLGPDLGDHLAELSSRGVRSVVVCPVGFVSDHLEVLYDIDIEAQAKARELGIRLERARSMNDDPIFVAGLADVLERRLAPVPTR